MGGWASTTSRTPRAGRCATPSPPTPTARPLWWPAPSRPTFYVRSGRTVRVARQLYGDAIYETRQATVAVPPVAWACRRRVDATRLERDHRWARWPVVHPVFVALDLALDPSRGREILDGWSPPEPFRRVW